MILLVACHVDYIWIMHGIDILTSSFWSHVVVQFLCWAFMFIPYITCFRFPRVVGGLGDPLARRRASMG